jgi:glycosyltransferase involved in cell wall biosynthesis
MHNNDLVQEHSYSDTIVNSRVAIIGPLPPPLGGVSVHVERTIQKLKRQGNVVVQYDPESIYPFAWLRMPGIKYAAYVWYMAKLCIWLIRMRPQVMIYHNFYARTILPELLLIRMIKRVFGSRVILVEHDCRHMYARTASWIKTYSRLIVTIDHLVLIGSVTAHSYRTHAIAVPPCTSIESAFLPPDIARHAEYMAAYPQTLIDFLHTHSPTVLVSAFACVIWQGKDLYGLDQAIAVCATVCREYPCVGLVIVLGSIGDREHYRRLHALIEQYNLQQSVYVLQGNYILWPLFAHVDIFIRPTLSDGASVSVQEALFCGVPTIASDVCWRPDGAMLYKASDSVDLYMRIQQVLKQKGYAHADK